MSLGGAESVPSPRDSIAETQPMVSQSGMRKRSHRLAWTMFVLSLVGWFILRGAYGMGAGCDLLIAIALAAQAWLLFLTVDKHQ